MEPKDIHELFEEMFGVDPLDGDPAAQVVTSGVELGELCEGKMLTVSFGFKLCIDGLTEDQVDAVTHTIVDEVRAVHNSATESINAIKVAGLDTEDVPDEQQQFVPEV